MTSRDFCFWMQGFFELRGEDAPITAEQAACIQKHLALVFVHEIDPSAGGPAEQAKLNAAHTAEPATNQHLSSQRPPPPGGFIVRC